MCSAAECNEDAISLFTDGEIECILKHYSLVEQKKSNNCVWEILKRSEMCKFTVNLTVVRLPCENCPAHTREADSTLLFGVRGSTWISFSCQWSPVCVSMEQAYWCRNSLADGTGPQQDANKSSNTLKLMSVHSPLSQTCPQGRVLLFLWDIERCIRWLTDLDTYWSLPEVPCFRNVITTSDAGASWQCTQTCWQLSAGQIRNICQN